MHAYIAYLLLLVLATRGGLVVPMVHAGLQVRVKDLVKFWSTKSQRKDLVGFILILKPENILPD